MNYHAVTLHENLLTTIQDSNCSQLTVAHISLLTRGEFGPGAGPPFLNLSQNSRSGLGGMRPDPH